MQKALAKGRATLKILYFLYEGIPIDLVLHQTYAGMLRNV